MIANKSPGVVDWTIIPNNPDASILDEYMDVDSHSQLDEWEDIVEEDITIDMQGEMDNKTAVRHTSLQTMITCVIPIFLWFLFIFSIAL
jgi:hypothetical protein